MSHRRKWPIFFGAAEFVCYHRYGIKYIESDHEVACPEYKDKDGDNIVVVPWFLFLGRPYPVQIYLFVCDQYSSNPKRGQRWAAEETRKKFKLKTFSHTTLCRVFNKLEGCIKTALEKRFGEEYKICAEPAPAPAPEIKPIIGDEQKAAHEKRCFPSVEDTAERRKAMSAFLKTFHDAALNESIETAGCAFVKYWHGKNRRLLL